MALGGAIDTCADGIVRNLGDVGMTIAAFDLAVNASIVYSLIDIIIPSLAVLIDPSHLSMSVAHETVVFVGGVGLEAVKEG